MIYIQPHIHSGGTPDPAPRCDYSRGRLPKATECMKNHAFCCSRIALVKRTPGFDDLGDFWSQSIHHFSDQKTSTF